jgi:phage FluMu protein Com
VRAREHDPALLEVRCPRCHRLTLRKQTWPLLDEYKAQIVARAKARRVTG